MAAIILAMRKVGLVLLSILSLAIYLLAQSSSSTPKSDSASASSGSTQQPMRIRVNQGVLKPIHKVTPDYPEAARQSGVEGKVVLNAVIATDGKIAKLDPISGDPALVQAAIDAVKQWRFQPLTAKGVPVEVETQIDVSFSRN